jgi:putative transposase
VSVRVARSRELVARGFAVAAVARVLQISRQAIYRTPTPRRPPQRRPVSDPVEQAIVDEALANQTDGYRMICAFVRRRLGLAVNRKRVLRVMRERKLIQRRRPLERRKRPGFFRVERPRQLWQLDMSSVWVAEHGWTYLMAIIDCCTREIVAWQLELRCRADEAIAVVERAVAVYGIEPGELTLGSDNGSAFTARRFKAKLAELGLAHRRGGYRDPESQAFIECHEGRPLWRADSLVEVTDPRRLSSDRCWDGSESQASRLARERTRRERGRDRRGAAGRRGARKTRAATGRCVRACGDRVDDRRALRA